MNAASISEALLASPLHTIAVDLLSNVPGLPPILQTVHLLSIAAIMGSVVLIDLRVLGLALPSQDVREMVRRLMPWVWSVLPLLAVSGLMFILATPRRYFANPVFQLKFVMLVPALALAALFHRTNLPEGRLARPLAAISMCLWLAIAMAGRWIAYVDYIWPQE
jgi:uncharacterized membrane protein SirB2